MITMLKDWEGPVEVNGHKYDSIGALISVSKPLSGSINIKLYPKQEKGLVGGDNGATRGISKPVGTGIYRITVKKYMTEQSSPGFDFMAKWNNDHPMPLRTMTGKVLEETKGMVKMQLHGDIWAEKICTCMCCGRKLTNPVSQYFGIGPECGGHNYVNPFEDEQQLKEAVEDYKKKLQAITWEGWVIKSAITEKEEVV